MDFNDYFTKRTELTMRVLADTPEVPEPSVDYRPLAIGAFCLAGAAVMHVWAALALVDPGYFARSSNFSAWLVLAGACVVVVAILACAWLTRGRAQAREALKERTVARLISADRVVARQLAAGRTAES